MLLKKGNTDSIPHFYENDIDKTVLYYIVTMSFGNEQKRTSLMTSGDDTSQGEQGDQEPFCHGLNLLKCLIERNFSGTL